MSENKEIKVNDNVYYSSPSIGTEGSVLKDLKMKVINYIKELENKIISLE